jgi:hypothetical protein
MFVVSRKTMPKQDKINRSNRWAKPRASSSSSWGPSALAPEAPQPLRLIVRKSGATIPLAKIKSE